MLERIKQATIDKYSDEIKKKTEEIAESLTDKISNVSEAVQSKTDSVSKSVGALFESSNQGESIKFDVEVENESCEISTIINPIDDFDASDQQDMYDEVTRLQQESAAESFRILEDCRKRKKKKSIAAVIAGVVVAGSAMGGISEHSHNVAMAESYDKAVSYVMAEEYDLAIVELTEVTIDDAEAISGYAYVQSNIDDYMGKPGTMLGAISEIDSIENKDVKRQQTVACEDLKLAEEIQSEIDSLDLTSLDTLSKGAVDEIETNTAKLGSRYRILLTTDKYDLAERVLTNVESKNEAGQLLININNLGEITLDSKAEIDELQSAYNNLSSSDKKTILNYSALTAAANTYKELEKAEEERIAAEKKAEEERQAAEEKAEKERLAAAAKEAENNEETVYVSRTGTKYHSNPYCSNMRNPIEMSRSQAENMGKDPCSKCY